MKIRIMGKDYDGTLQPFIGDLRLLKPSFGFGWGTVITRMQKLDTDPAGLFAALDDDEFLQALIAYVWMVKLRAGERDVTREEVESTLSIDQFQMISDDTVGSDAPPPT